MSGNFYTGSISPPRQNLDRTPRHLDSRVDRTKTYNTVQVRTRKVKKRLRRIMRGGITSLFGTPPGFTVDKQLRATSLTLSGTPQTRSYKISSSVPLIWRARQSFGIDRSAIFSSIRTGTLQYTVPSKLGGKKGGVKNGKTLKQMRRKR